MLDIETTNNLITKAKGGCEHSKSVLLSENSPLIKSVIKKYLNKGIEFDDLYQLGSLGFLKAIDNFDESFGVKFSTYAVPMIAGEVKRYIRDNGIIKVPRGTKQLNIKINRFIEEFIKNNEVSPGIDVIAEEFGFFGVVMIIILYSILFGFLIYMITKNQNNFGRIIITGVFVNLFFHFFINIGMITGILPVVGMPLPLLSYGGSITASTKCKCQR